MSKFGFIILFLMIALNELMCQENTIIYVEESASFQGKDLTYFLNNFVKPNLQYPDSALKNNTIGRTIVQFAVDSVGQVVDIKILRSLDPYCDKEAIRVIKLSNGMWTPGKVKNKNIKQLFTLPIEFAAPNNDNNLKK